MKFKDYKLTKDQYGFEFAKSGVMKGSQELRCMHCGELTEFIEVCSESHFCSDECVDAWYKSIDGMYGMYDDELN